jgi:predicted phosphodiesterase
MYIKKIFAPMSDLVCVVSDLHCDVSQTPFSIKRPKANTLVLAGDLSSVIDRRYRDFLGTITRDFKSTVYVAGNHEFYGSPGTISQTLEYIDKTCRSLPGDVHLLCRGNPPWKLPDSDVTFVGATLWTDVKNPPDNPRDLLNDFTMIDGGKYSIDYMRELHESDRAHISESLDFLGGGSVVVTHHCPDRRLSVMDPSRSYAHINPFYFCTDMAKVFRETVQAWCYGHTHESHVMFLPRVSSCFVTNARGYVGEETGFVPNVGIKI